jgi:flavin reductase (DIM6/NTAB) family NADH-FMN oxidoreductase RutF
MSAQPVDSAPRSVEVADLHPAVPDFKRGMRRLAGGVTAIAVVDDNGNRLGAAATAVCSLSVAPPALIVCLNLEGSVGRALRPGCAFSVNVLGERHEELARVFGGMTGTPSSARFEHGSWLEGAHGVPILSDALVTFECVAAHQSVSYATHLIVIGEVGAVTLGEPGAALSYREGAFRTVA